MNIVEFMGQLVSTMMDVYDKGYIAHSKGDLQRSIQIPVTLQSTVQIKKYEQRILRLHRKKAKHFFKME